MMDFDVQLGEQLFELRKYSRSIGGPEATLALIEFLQENKNDLPTNIRKTFDGAMGNINYMFSLVIS